MALNRLQLRVAGCRLRVPPFGLGGQVLILHCHFIGFELPFIPLIKVNIDHRMVKSVVSKILTAKPQSRKEHKENH